MTIATGHNVTSEPGSRRWLMLPVVLLAMFMADSARSACSTAD